MAEQNSNSSNKAFTQDMSPLDMLEQNSRRLADRLQNTTLGPSSKQQPHNTSSSQRSISENYTNPAQNARIPQPPRAVDRDGSRRATSSPYHHHHHQQQQQQQMQQRMVIEDGDEWRPDARASVISRAGSISSVNSFGGGILDSFRLSSLPGVKDNMQQFRDDRSILSYDDDEDDDDEEEDRKTVTSAGLQEPSPIEPSDSVSIRPIRSRVQSIDETQQRREQQQRLQEDQLKQQQQQQQPLRSNAPAALEIGKSDQNTYDGDSLLSPTTSINSDTSSVYTAASHFSTHLQGHSRQGSRPKIPQSRSFNTHPGRTGSPQSPSTNQPYFFPDAVRKQQQQQQQQNQYQQPKPTPTRSSSVGLMVPPSLRGPNNNNPSASSSGAASPNSSPKISGNKGFDDDRAITNKLFKDMSMEEHVTTGIALHESGNLRESSYHWQYAAFKGEYTAMLLYGLALRHGWGMRKNPTEAVKWLRSAMENSIGEGFGFEPASSKGSKNNNNTRMSIIQIPEGEGSTLKKAHIGLALYELGMSYLHSWGTEKDEEMALKSFEMAGQLGDSDALCEAAALYMKNGPKGRKKDLQKAARLYREAGDLGANMVGQSWIYKDKYMPSEEKEKKKEKKHRFK